jgi:hypothetical protein
MPVIAVEAARHTVLSSMEAARVVQITRAEAKQGRGRDAARGGGDTEGKDRAGAQAAAVVGAATVARAARVHLQADREQATSVVHFAVRSATASRPLCAMEYKILSMQPMVACRDDLAAPNVSMPGTGVLVSRVGS